MSRVMKELLSHLQLLSNDLAKEAWDHVEQVRPRMAQRQPEASTSAGGVWQPGPKPSGQAAQGRGERTGSPSGAGNLQDPIRTDRLVDLADLSQRPRGNPHTRTTRTDTEHTAGTALPTGATSLSRDETGPAGEIGL
ncbi:unnamed protein product [Boreogadus saida]